MAATGYTPISLYYSTTASAVPVNTNLVNGELAINITDGKLYYKDNSGVVKLLASNAATTNVTTFSAGTTGFTPSSATSGAVTLAGTLATTNGGTGLTAFTSGGAMYATSTSVLTTGTLPVTAGGTGLTTLTAGYIPYGNGTSAFSSSANLYFSGTNLGIGTTSPNVKLDVNGINGWSGSTTGIVSSITGVNSATGSGGNLRVLTSTSAADDVGGSVTLGGYFSTTTNSVDFAEISGRKQSGQTTGGYMVLATRTDLGNITERMRITSAGLVCINGTSGTALATIASSTTYPALKVPNIVETANTVAGAPASTQTFYLASGAVQYYTSNAANNWTVNFAMSSGTSLNTAMAVGDSMSCTMLTTQGSTAYYNSAVQIDGTSVTPKWQGGTAPTSGNASSIDSYTYVIYKTASATYTVLASQTKFA